MARRFGTRTHARASHGYYTRQPEVAWAGAPSVRAVHRMRTLRRRLDASEARARARALGPGTQTRPRRTALLRVRAFNAHGKSAKDH